MSETERFTLAEAQKEFAKRTNGLVWNLLGKTKRSPAENEEMECAAFTSLFHWLQVGTEVHHQRAQWLIAHVYSVLGESEPAVKHANRCLALTEKNKDQMQDFDMAYAYEGMARAHALRGDQEIAAKYFKLAESSGEAISDEESREIFFSDLNTGNWYGIR